MAIALIAAAGLAGFGWWHWRIRRDAADEAWVLRAIGRLGPGARITAIHEEFLRTGRRPLSIVAVGVHVVELQHRGLVTSAYGEPIWENGPRPELFSTNEKPATASAGRVYGGKSG